MTRSDIAVSFSGACKAFGDKEVLHGVDFEIGRGEVVSLIGPSGAGKSTMLRCLTLLETLDAGRIAYGDAVVCEGAEKAVYNKAAMREARMRFGLVFQDYNLFPHRTVLQNVMDAPLIVQHRKEDEVRKEAEDLLGRLGLEGREGAVPCELSGGQQQRVAIARALCMNPEVMYFDEATSALDPKLTKDMHDLIRQLAKEGMAIIMVSSELPEIMGMSDRVIVYHEGKVSGEFSRDEIVSGGVTQEDILSKAFGV